MEAAQTTTLDIHFALRAEYRGFVYAVQILIWPRYTPVRPRIQPSPPPVSSFASEPTVPSFWPRSDLPGRIRGAELSGLLRSRGINRERRDSGMKLKGKRN